MRRPVLIGAALALAVAVAAMAFLVRSRSTPEVAKLQIAQVAPKPLDAKSEAPAHAAVPEAKTAGKDVAKKALNNGEEGSVGIGAIGTKGSGGGIGVFGGGLGGELKGAMGSSIGSSSGMGGLGLRGTGSGGGGYASGMGGLGLRGTGAGGGDYASGSGSPKVQIDYGQPQISGNRYPHLAPSTFVATSKDALSTFAIDVDTASYTLMRRYLESSALPPPDAIRVEEHVNYFRYRYAPPEQGAFAVHLEAAPSPFSPGRQLLRVGIQGKALAKSQRKPAHLTFLVDSSGSMGQDDKLPLAQEAMKIAVRNLNENDTVAIVTYAGESRDVLPPTPATEYQTIFAAIDSLHAGGSTAMGSGLELAYKHAVSRASGGVTSRVVMLTDGDANIGPNLSADAMLESIHKYAQEGVTLTAVGFGMGNYRDDLMEKLADKGNGNCFYVDGLREARRVFQTQLTGTLEIIAKDVKVQVELNPEAVSEYRLLGYEDRAIADQDFRNDKVDAGEIGAGHSVTALYEVKLQGSAEELATVRIRAKEPNGTAATEQAFTLRRSELRPSIDAASPDFRFAAAVAGTAEILRHSAASEAWSLATAEKLAASATLGDAEREDYVRLLGIARSLWARAHNVASK